ncbi:retinoblastoma-like protein 1 [Trichonephila clavipes]|uniref:Retinoblastoma-like protein 1 n=1 Tax=Trichonephila clavipes TaxID=2585209 RepID=A0A8X6UZM6_TRICX|nr:retinoblastoma-like protein 1 [Trichonephila clavipes]
MDSSLYSRDQEQAKYCTMKDKPAPKKAKSVPSSVKLESPPLSPLPRLNAHPSSPWRRVSSKHSLYIAPLVNTQFPPSPGKPLSCCFNKSPAKDLRAINNFVKLGDKKVVKRLLQDDNDSENPPKRLCEDLTLRKIQDVITERQGGNNSNGLPE